MPNAEVDPIALLDSFASSSLDTSLLYSVVSVHDIEMEGIAHQLKISCASLRPDSLDLAFKITLDNAEENVFDIAVSKEEFISYWSEEALSRARLVELKFNKRDGRRFLCTTYMSIRDPISLDRIDFTIECMGSEECAILSWAVNGKQVMQGCWG